MALIRLDKFLADAGAGTRSEVKKYIQKGRITVDGACIKRPECKVDPLVSEITLDGSPVEAAPEFVYYLLHKPAGYVTATEDAREATVMELVPSTRKGLFPVGRLDKDTEGLLLITDDGALAHRLLSPKKHVDKTYYARVEGLLGEASIRQTEEGLDIGDDKPTLPAKLEILGTDEGQRTCEILLTIREGRYHQVKRMVEVLGGRVTYLKRLSMGGLTLPEDLEKGQCRPLTEQELKRLL
jgi:16S rRNA pseudouridine516 synthase